MKNCLVCGFRGIDNVYLNEHLIEDLNIHHLKGKYVCLICYEIMCEVAKVKK